MHAVTLTKYGGLAAGMRRPAKTVDTREMPAAAADELARLVKAAQAGQATQATAEGPSLARDAMTYKITVEDGDTPVALKQSDTTMSSAFAALRAWLEKYHADK